MHRVIHNKVTDSFPYSSPLSLSDSKCIETIAGGYQPFSKAQKSFHQQAKNLSPAGKKPFTSRQKTFHQQAK